jgi:hypothetical protein
MKTAPTSAKQLLFVLTLISGLLVLFPSLLFQELLSQGDHGRDLYAFMMTAEGGAPYKDYLWVYGPLMPYYYALFFLVLGESIRTVLIAEGILKLLTGLCIFLAMRMVVFPFWAYLSALFFWTHFPFFFYTYNHTGGILLLSLIVLALIRYIYERADSVIYLGLGAVFLLSFVKINIGLGALLGYVLCVLYIDKKYPTSKGAPKRFYLISLIAVPALIFTVYYLITRGLPEHVLKQCFPYSKKGVQRTIALAEVLPDLSKMIAFLVSTSLQNLLIVLTGLVAAGGYLLRRRKIDVQERTTAGLVLFCLSVFAAVQLHEYVPSGVYYRIIWSLFFVFPVLFVVLEKFLKTLPRNVNFAAMGLIVLLVFSKMNADYRNMGRFDDPLYYFGHKRAGILVGNPAQWMHTAKKTTDLLETVLADGESFFAFPYEPLYYFLLDRQSPTYQIAFFDYMDITDEQDRQTVKDLADKKIRWIIYSNRIDSDEPTMGKFGISHSQALYAYINDNFELMGEIGDWEYVPGWNTFHGMRILKRKE